MTQLTSATDKVVRAAVDSFLVGNLRVESEGEMIFETKHSRYRLVDGVLFGANDASLVGAELVGWLVDKCETPRMETSWRDGSRGVLVDRKRNRHIVVTSGVRSLRVNGRPLPGSPAPRPGSVAPLPPPPPPPRPRIPAPPQRSAAPIVGAQTVSTALPPAPVARPLASPPPPPPRPASRPAPPVHPPPRPMAAPVASTHAVPPSVPAPQMPPSAPLPRFHSHVEPLPVYTAPPAAPRVYVPQPPPTLPMVPRAAVHVPAPPVAAAAIDDLDSINADSMDSLDPETLDTVDPETADDMLATAKRMPRPTLPVRSPFPASPFPPGLVHNARARTPSVQRGVMLR